jgi:hypothetical protein
MSQKCVDFDTVRQIALGLPGVTESMGALGRSYRVGGKMLACKAIHRSAEEGSLVVRVDLGRRKKLLASAPDVYYVTPHYQAYPSVLVRLAKIDREALAQLLSASREFVMGPGVRRVSRASRKGLRG